MTQHQALQVMLSGNNVFLTGQPGSGKTYLLNEFIVQAKKLGLNIAVTATTGIAATHLDGITIHSWAGFGIKDRLDEIDKLRLSKNSKLVDRYRFIDTLVIDEVSMLDSRRLDAINDLSKVFRGNNLPMGGIQLILVGDLFQLSPVNSGRDSYLFNSQTWNDLNLKICYLTEQHRQQQGDELISILQAIRGNRISRTEIEILKSKLKSQRPAKSDTLRLYTHNYDVDEINNKNYMALNNREKIYKMHTKGRTGEVAALKKAVLSPELLKLKVGCEVIFTANNYSIGYVNGDRGRVVDFKSGLPVVRMNRSIYLTVTQHNWKAEADGRVVAYAWQLPLKLAWAITIHKSQGMSLDEAEIDLSHAFSLGMGYVALSRLRNIDGLYLLGLNKMALYVDSNILKLDKVLRAASDKVLR